MSDDARRRAASSSRAPSAEHGRPSRARAAAEDDADDHRRRPPARGAARPAGDRRLRGRRHLRAAVLLPPADDVGRHVPPVPRRGRGPARPDDGRQLHDAGRRGPGRAHRRPTAVKRAQEGVLELLLANHPLDCPVCDKGGECPLQDQAFSHGPGESRYVEEKRHFEKPIPISDLVVPRPRALHPVRPLHPLRRRGRRRQADPLHPAAATRRRCYTFPDEPFASYFSGNTVQICPVGALTAKPYRFKARPWDLEQVESTCTTCSVGCRIVVQSSRDELVRYQGVDSDPVNWGWLCDRGRFDFEAVNSARPSRRATRARPTTAARRAIVGDGARPRPPTLIARGAGRRRAGRRSPCSAARAARNEDAFAWARLAHDVIGTPNVDAQLGDGLPVELLGLPRATIDEAASAHDDRAARARPEGRAAGPVPAPARRRREAHAAGSSSSRRSRPGSRRTRGSRSAASRAPSRRPSRARSPTTRSRAQLGAGPRRDRRRSGEPGRVDRPAPSTRCSCCSPPVPGAKVLPALRRGNVVGALQLGLRPGRRRPRRARDPAGRRRGQDRVPRAARRRPARRLPRRRPRPPGAGRRAPDHRRRHVPHRDSTRSPTSCSPRPRTARRPARPPTSRVGCTTRRPQGHAARHDPARLDDRRRARRRASARDLGWSTPSTTSRREIAATVPGVRRRRRRDALARDARRRPRDRCRRRSTRSTTPCRRAGRPQQLRLPPRGQPQALRPGGRHDRESPSLAAPRHPAARPHVHPLDLERARRRGRRRGQGVTSPRGTRRARRASPTRRCCAARCGCRSTSRASTSAT